MKKIEAIIRKSKYSEVKEALHKAGVNFFSHWDVTGIGNEQKGNVYRGVSYSTSEIQRRFLSIVVNDEFVQPAIDAIIKTAATDRVGDGKIFVLAIEEAYRIRTGEKGGDTLN
jgi:nitrogen regulatory protein P-II 1